MSSTRYNSRDHPVAFHKAEALGKAPKKLAATGPAPDLEEAFDVRALNTEPVVTWVTDGSFRLTTRYQRLRRTRSRSMMTQNTTASSKRPRRAREPQARGRPPPNQDPRRRAKPDGFL